MAALPHHINQGLPERRLHGRYHCSVIQPHIWRGWRRPRQVPLPQCKSWTGVPAAWPLRRAHGPIWTEVLAASLAVASAGDCCCCGCLCCCCFRQHLCCAGAAVHTVEVLAPCGCAWVTDGELSTTSIICRTQKGHDAHCPTYSAFLCASSLLTHSDTGRLYT